MTETIPVLSEYPSPTPTSPVLPPISAPPHKSGSSLIVVLLILFLAAFSAATYFYLQNRALLSSRNPSPTPAASVSTAAEVSPSPVSSALANNQLSVSGSLQDFLKANCQKAQTGWQLPAAKLPLNVPGAGTWYCSSDDPDVLQHSVASTKINNRWVYLYDDTSVELGHGGAPFTGVFGEKVYESGNTAVYANIGYGDAMSLIGNTGIDLRGRKAFVAKTGEAYYLNLFTLQAIPGDDSRLVAYLKPYGTYDPQLGMEPGQLIVDPSKFNTKTLIDHFFSPTPKAGTPEYAALEAMKGELNAITVK